MSNRIMHFEIHANDLERCANFYRKVFGWDIKKWEGGNMDYWMVMTAPEGSTEPGINGGLLIRGGKEPEEGMGPNAFVCSIVVEDYDAIASAIADAGGVCQMPKFDIAGMAWQGYYKDTEGNIFGVHQPKVAH